MSINTEALMAKLFRWKKTLELEGTKFYIRVVSDQVIDDARRSALIEARRLRRSLRDVNSDDYLIHLDPIDDLTDEELQNLVVVTAMRQIMKDYINTNPRPVIEPLGDNPTQEQQENYEEARELREQAYITDMQAYVDNWREEYTAGLQKRDRDYTLRVAKSSRIDQVCEDKFSEIFEDYVVAASVYADDKYKTRMFTVEQYKELPTEIKKELRDAYNDMSISPEDIKN